jgi:hypothetical protein|tara:strand:+ start:125 stop:298 length:174 start_codon:yes stop_codon:yes gene_type:complete
MRRGQIEFEVGHASRGPSALVADTQKAPQSGDEKVHQAETHLPADCCASAERDAAPA